MNILLFLSDSTIPLLIFLIVGYGLLNRSHVYDDFIKGAKDGFQTVIGIMPTLVGLMVGVGVLRASGFLDLISAALGVLTEPLHYDELHGDDFLYDEHLFYDGKGAEDKVYTGRRPSDDACGHSGQRDIGAAYVEGEGRAGKKPWFFVILLPSCLI